MTKGLRKPECLRILFVTLIALFVVTSATFGPQALVIAETNESDAYHLSFQDIPELAPADRSISLHLASGSFDPLLKPVEPLAIPGMPQITKESILPGESAYYLVQLKGPVTDEQKKHLLQAGSQIFDYIPEFAFIVKMDNRARSIVETYNFIRWIGMYQPGYRVEPKLTKELSLSIPSRPVELVVVTFSGQDMNDISDQLETLGGRILNVTSAKWKGKIRVETESAKIGQIAAIPGVKWVEEAPVWKLTNNVARDIMNVGPIGNPKNLFGKGQIVAVADTGLDRGSTDPAKLHDDFENGNGNSRVIQILDLAGDGAVSDVNSGHGTHVAGSVLGNGVKSGSNPLSHDYVMSYAGVAPEAELIFQAVEDNSNEYLTGIPNDLNLLFDQARTAGAHIHTNSWGNSVSGAYTSFSEDVDENAWNNRYFTILFAAGNEGIDSNADGIIDLYSVVAPGTAKNCITVGDSESNRPPGSSPTPAYDFPWGTGSWAVEYPVAPIASDHVSNNPEGMAAFSSQGPCLDGRTKPDVVAPGTNIISTLSSRASPSGLWGSGGLTGGLEKYYVFSGGTSMSTPLVAGSAALVREFYTDQGVTPSSALIKGTLINGAKDMSGQYETYEVVDGPRPNQAEGWGRVDLQKTLFPSNPRKMEYHDVTPGLTTGGTDRYGVEVTDTTEPLRVTLVWTDYPGSPTAGGGLVNDLDLSVIDPLGTTHYSNGAVQRGITQILSYDDGEADGGYSWSMGKGFAVRFTPTSYPVKLDKVNIALLNIDEQKYPYPRRFTANVWDDNGGKPGTMLGSVSYTIRAAGWPVVDFSNNNITIASGDFYVEVRFSDKSLGLLYDDDPPVDGRSWNFNGTSWSQRSGKDFMIRAIVTSSDNTTPYDRVNNVEGVDIDTPVQGKYTININGFNVPQGPQPYALVISGAVGGPLVATPTFSPGPGTFTTCPVLVSISCATSGTTIRYTTDGSTPNPGSPVYSGPVSLSATTTLKAKGFKTGMADSDVATGTYTLNCGGNWESEAVNWRVDYGNNWSKSGTITKPGAIQIRLHFSTINVEANSDHLRTDVENDWSGSFSNVTSNEKADNSIGLTLTSNGSITGYFIIDRVDWQGISTGPATFTGDLAPTLYCIVAVPPDHWKGEYFNNRTLSGSPSMVRDDGAGNLNFDWGTGSPGAACGIGADNFSVRWTRTISFNADTYRFTVRSDDGVRLYVDDQLKLDKWFDQPPTTYTVDVTLKAGNHTIKLEYYEKGGGAVAQVLWQPTPGSRWVSIGPDGAVVKILAVDPQTPDTLYAGTDSGVYKSINGGTSWTAMNSGLTNDRVTALAIDPRTPDTLYTGTDSGVYKSTDGGMNWTAINKGLPGTSAVSVLAIDPQTPNTLYAGTTGFWGGGVYKTTNGGTSWTAILDVAHIYALAIDPKTPMTLYAGDHRGYVHKSTNGGTRWIAVNTGLTHDDIYALAIDPQTPNTLYAGTTGFWGGTVYKSTNGGTRWIAVNTGLTHDDVYALAIDPQTPSTLYAGTWGGGVYKSTNGGTSWTAMNSGLTNDRVTTLAIDPQTPDIIYAGTSGGGVFKFQ